MLFSIGQVAKMYDISHDTLRYYDKIDLLKPSIKKDNGYRYYAIKELELLEIILVAKGLEIPINNIKDIIKKEDIDNYIHLFENHEKILEEKIKYLTDLKSQVKKSKYSARKMKDFSNEETVDLSYKVIDKSVVFFNQNGNSYIGTASKSKNLFMILNKSFNNNITMDESLVGIELHEGEEFDFKDCKDYIKKDFKGEYIVLTRKDTYSNLKKFLIDIINNLENKSYKNKEFNILLESMFNITKQNGENIYLMNLYIPKI